MAKISVIHRLLKGKSITEKRQSELSRLRKKTASKLAQLKSGELSDAEIAYINKLRQSVEADDYSKRLDIEKKYKDKIESIRDKRKIELKEKRFIQIIKIYNVQLKKEGMTVNKLYSNFIKLIEDLQSQRINEFRKRNKKYSNENYSNIKKNKEFRNIVLEIFKEQLVEIQTKESSTLTLKDVKQNLAKAFRETYSVISLESFGQVTKSNYIEGYKLDNIKLLDLSFKSTLTSEEVGSLFHR